MSLLINIPDQHPPQCHPCPVTKTHSNPPRKHFLNVLTNKTIMEGLTAQSRGSLAFASERFFPITGHRSPCGTGVHRSTRTSTFKHFLWLNPRCQLRAVRLFILSPFLHLPYGTLGSIPVNHEMDAFNFYPSAPQHDMCPEWQTLFGSSISHQESRVPVAQGDQEYAKCTSSGCSRVVKKGSYTRHVNETHLRKVKAVCARCGRAFLRTYMKKSHELTCRGVGQ
jgi:hypothetical protein